MASALAALSATTPWLITASRIAKLCACLHGASLDASHALAAPCEDSLEAAFHSLAVLASSVSSMVYKSLAVNGEIFLLDLDIQISSYLFR